MAIVLVLLLSLLLRIVNLNQSLWLDEAISVITARDLSFFQLIKHFASADFHPPLHSILLHFWGRIFGWSEVVVRLPSVFFGVATVWLVYQIAKVTVAKQFNSLPLFSAFLMAIAPFHIYYSQEARPYVMATFLSCLSTYFLIKLINRFELAGENNKLLLFVYLVAATLLVYTDYYGFLLLLAQGLSVFFIARDKLKKWCCQTAIIFIFYLPWLPTFLAQLKAGFASRLSLPAWQGLVNISFLKAIPLTIIKFSFGRISFFNKTLYLLGAAGLFLFYTLLLINSSYKHNDGKEKIKKYLPLLFWFFLPLTIAWFLSLFIPNYQPFRLLVILPAFYLLLALLIYQNRMQLLKMISVLIVITFSLVSLAVYYFNPYFQREDWKTTVNFINQQSQAKVILPSATSVWPWHYYSTNEAQLVAVAEGINQVKLKDQNKLDLLFSEDRVFYIRYLVPLFDPQEQISLWLNDRGFVKIGERSFNQIEVWEYQIEERS